jgi:hypothetical protein
LCENADGPDFAWSLSARVEASSKKPGLRADVRIPSAKTHMSHKSAEASTKNPKVAGRSKMRRILFFIPNVMEILFSLQKC